MSSSSALNSPSPVVIFDEKNRRSRPRAPLDHHFDVIDQLDDGMGLVTVAEAVSVAAVGEICQAGVQMARATTATISNHRRLQFLSDENEPIVDLRFVKDDDSLKNNDIDGEDEDDGEAQFSSSEEPDGVRSNDDDVLTDSETSKESSSLKDDPHYFDTDFEDNGNASDIESVVDTIEYYARSISGLTFLSDLGVEDPGDREVFDIEEKVIKEYGLDYIQKFEKKIGDDDEPNNSTDESNEEKSGNRGDQRPRQSKESSSLKPNTTATTAAEILDDIIHAELEGEEVEYDPTKRESIRQSRIRSLHKSFGMIRNLSPTRSSRKNSEFAADKEIKIQEPQDALTNRGAAVALANTYHLEEDEANAGRSDSMEIVGAGAVIENQGSNKGHSNLASQMTISGHSYADTDKVPFKRIRSNYSYAYTNEVPTDPQQKDRISNLGNTATLHNESGDRASHEDWYIPTAPMNILKRIERVDSHSVNKDPHLPVERSDHGEKERTKKIASNLDRFESKSQQQQQHLEVIHNPNGPLVRLSSLNRNSSSSSMGSSAYYDNKEVVYDPTAFVEAPIQTPNKKSHQSLLNHSGAKLKNHNSCCDLRSITTVLQKTRSHEDKKQLCNESNHREASTPKSPWKVIDDVEYQHSTPSHHHRQSYPSSESEGVEMQLHFDCLKSVKSTKSHIKGSMPEKNRKKKDRSTRRFLDPERLFCGLKHPQPRIKDDRPVIPGKKATKETKKTTPEDRKSNDPQSSKSKAELASIGAEAVNHILEKENLCGKENAYNISMETATTAASEDDEDSSKFQVEVSDIISVISSDDPLISALLQETRTSPREHKKPFNIDYIPKRPPSRESFSIAEPNNSEDDHTIHSRDKTRISVITQIRKRDSAYLLPDVATAETKSIISCPVPMLPEVQPDFGSDLVPCPVPELEEAKPNYGGDLVDLLQTISSYVDGIVEKNNYSLPLPSTPAGGVLENNKDGREDGDENSNLKTEYSHEIKINIVSGTSGAKPPKGEMLDAIYVPTSRTPEKVESSKTTPKDDTNDERSIDLLSLFDNSLSYSEISHSNLTDKSDPHPKTTPKSFIDDELSEDFSLIVGSSVERSITSTKPSQQQREEIQKPWDGENPVVYHMSSSPPLANRSSRATKKRTIFKRTVERHSTPLKTAAKDRSALGREAKRIDENDDLCSVGSLPYRATPNPRPEGSLEKRPAREETTQTSQSSRRNFFTEMENEDVQNRSVFHEKNRSSQPPLPKPTKPTYRERRRPPTPPTVTKAVFDQTDVVTATNVEQHRQTSSRSNGLVIDENGFILDRNADILEDLEKRSDAATFQPYESIPKPVMRGEELFLVAGSTKGIASSTTRVNSRLARRSIRFQAIAGSDSHRRIPIDAENSYSEQEPYWKSMTSTGQVLVNGQDLHSRLHR
jgi:hypothetical protein